MPLTEQINLKVAELNGACLNTPLQRLEQQQSHQHCMLCGPNSLLGLKLNFYSNQDGVWTIAQGSIHQQGYNGILHGGFLSALLDAAMCQAVFNQKIEAVTADMNIRFLHEIPINSELLVKGEVVSHYASLYKVKAQIYVKNRLMVKADARFMKRKIN